MAGRSPMDYTDNERFMDRQGMSVYYWTLVLGQIAAAISTTTKSQTVFGIGGSAYGFPNITLNLMFVFEIVLGIVAIYWAPMQSAFGTAPLPVKAMIFPIIAFV